MKKLPVPENIPLRWELWSGFGMQETIRTGIISVIVFVAAWIIGGVAGSENAAVIAVVAWLFVLFLCAGFFGRLDHNQSVYDYIKRWKRFSTEQQTFRYKKKDEVIIFVKEEAD